MIVTSNPRRSKRRTRLVLTRPASMESRKATPRSHPRDKILIQGGGPPRPMASTGCNASERNDAIGDGSAARPVRNPRSEH